MIRDKYKLRELFQKEKDKRIRQSQEKRQRIKNIKKEEKIRKIKHIKCLQKIEKIERERLEKKKYIEERIIIFKTTKYVEEFPITEERLYSTREELKEAEKRGEGAINWPLWDKLIEQGRKQILERLT